MMELVRPTTVRLKVEENQLVGVFDKIGVRVDGLKAHKMGVFSKSVMLRICRIWYKLASNPIRLRTIATST